MSLKMERGIVKVQWSTKGMEKDATANGDHNLHDA
jgi:hypothetical protein